MRRCDASRHATRHKQWRRKGRGAHSEHTHNGTRNGTHIHTYTHMHMHTHATDICGILGVLGEVRVDKEPADLKPERAVGGCNARAPERGRCCCAVHRLRPAVHADEERGGGWG